MRLQRCGFRLGFLVTFLAPALGCITPLQLAVTPTSPARPAAVEATCPDANGSVACLEGQQPSLQVTLTPGETVVWAKSSPDGHMAILSTAPTGYEKTTKWRGVVIAIDTAEMRELWRIQLSPNGSILPLDCFFSGDTRVVFQAAGTLMAVDRVSGREVWRFPVASDKTAEEVSTVTHDQKADLFIAQGMKATHLVDGPTGKALARQPRLGQMFNPLIAGGPVLFTDDGALVYDSGLMKLDRSSKSIAWKRRFVTHTTDDHMGANIGLAILGALVGGGGGSRPPDFQTSRVTVPVIAGDKLLVGALGVVHCIEYATGKLLWSADFGVPEIDQVVVKGDRVYALAGGHYLQWIGYGNLSIQQPVRYGLFALNISDGSAIAGFAPPHNSNQVARMLTALDVDKYDDDDAWEEEEDWISEAKSQARATAQQAAATSQQQGKLARTPKVNNWSPVKHVGFALTGAGVVLATADEVMLLDESTGAVLRRTSLKPVGPAVAAVPIGSVVLVRCERGLAVVDGSSGELSWQHEVPASADFAPFLDPGCVRLMRGASSSWLRGVEMRALGPKVFWACDETGTAVVPTAENRLVAFSVADGAKVWELDASRNTTIVPIGAHREVCTVDGNVVKVYRLPSS